ncbi:GNAT family N-acetyltransferase [Jannaschia sp. Os4]|uniref:GNAT family N-acetyltransferase n=1 Tax=Jannaschia sp. Os4 TaxID=2807617 RepID=UPI00193A26CB|nr:GNAT family N-acetyltransferase [Jannaschia sp. Os4]MBM2575837.1 GNAT family N-acetyltransferase [Jannaschia sp. Os4]
MPDSPLHTRPAAPWDAGAMALLLREIIGIGGTTALEDPPSGADLRAWMDTPGSLWSVAERDGEVVGFQWVEPHPDLPEGALDISTFVSPAVQGVGVGSALFAATVAAARGAGAAWINATILARNGGGRAYYRSRGFETYAITPGRDGRGDTLSKRYDL